MNPIESQSRAIHRPEPGPAVPLPPWKRCLRRYLVLDLFSLGVSLTLGRTALVLGGSTAWMIAGAVLGEMVGFYGLAWMLERREPGQDPAWRRVVAEFGPAECLDWLLIRPLALLAMASAIASPTGAIVAGGYLADLGFYTVCYWTYRVGKGSPVSSSNREAGSSFLRRSSALR